MNIHLFVHKMSDLSNKIYIYKLANDLENGVKVTKTQSTL